MGPDMIRYMISFVAVSAEPPSALGYLFDPVVLALNAAWVLLWIFGLFYIPWSRKNGKHLRYSHHAETWRLFAFYGAVTPFALFVIVLYFRSML